MPEPRRASSAGRTTSIEDHGDQVLTSGALTSQAARRPSVGGAEPWPPATRPGQSETGPASELAEAGPPKLHRNLSVWEAIGISLALMAPSMAASINPQGTATTVGRAVPIAFALAFVGVLLVAYTFVRLTQRFHHCRVGVRVRRCHPRPARRGDLRLGADRYLHVLRGGHLDGGRRFRPNFLNASASGRTRRPGRASCSAAIGMLLVWFLAITARPAAAPGCSGRRGHHRALIIVIVIVIVFAKLAGHSSPERARRGLGGASASRPACRVDDSSSGSSFGFLSFAGFEAASTLGEETGGPGGTSLGPSSAWPSSAASTSSWSRRSR